MEKTEENVDWEWEKIGNGKYILKEKGGDCENKINRSTKRIG